MKMEFSDGMKFDTSGEYRVELRSDGYYVVGQGMLCPVGTREEGLKLIGDLTKPGGPRFYTGPGEAVKGGDK